MERWRDWRVWAEVRRRRASRWGAKVRLKRCRVMRAKEGWRD